MIQDLFMVSIYFNGALSNGTIQKKIAQKILKVWALEVASIDHNPQNIEFIQDNPIFCKNTHFIPLANFETAVLKNCIYDLVLHSTVGKSTIEIYRYQKSFSILMLEIFIFVNLDHDSAASSKKCQYFLYRKFRVGVTGRG